MSHMLCSYVFICCKAKHEITIYILHQRSKCQLSTVLPHTHLVWCNGHYGYALKGLTTYDITKSSIASLNWDDRFRVIIIQTQPWYIGVRSVTVTALFCQAPSINHTKVMQCDEDCNATKFHHNLISWKGLNKIVWKKSNFSKYQLK